MEKEELIRRYNIDIAKLEAEQLKLAKSLSLKDEIDFSKVDRFGAVTNSMFKNKIVSAVIVCDKDFEIIEQQYFADKIRFPYFAGFVSYRDLPTMVAAFQKLDERPDVVFVSGNGIAHPRGLGLASQFSLSVQIPTIGVANALIEGDVKKENIVLNGKNVGKILVGKEGSRLMYVSPGNMISIKSAYELAKETINLPHKLPEPLHLARKYAKDIIKELR